MSQKISSLPFTGRLVGISSCGRCDYFNVKGKDEEYFVTTQFYSFLSLPIFPVYPLRQFIGAATGDSRVKVSAVLRSYCASSIFWAYLRMLFIVGFVVTFITTSTMVNKWTYQEGGDNVASLAMMWVVLVLYTWISVVLGVFYKPEANQKDTDRYTQLVLEQEGTPIEGLFANEESSNEKTTCHKFFTWMESFKASDTPDGGNKQRDFWIVLRATLGSICLFTFVIALALTLYFKDESFHQIENWWKYLVLWTVFLVALWCFAFFGIALKLNRKKTADKGNTKRQDLVKSGGTIFVSKEAKEPVPTENVLVKLGANSAEDVSQTTETTYSYDQPNDGHISASAELTGTGYM